MYMIRAMCDVSVLLVTDEMLGQMHLHLFVVVGLRLAFVNVRLCKIRVFVGGLPVTAQRRKNAQKRDSLLHFSRIHASNGNENL
jgi:hypothetical protein